MSTGGQAPVLFDLQGGQSLDHRDRGVARYVVELARAVEAADPSAVSAYLLNRRLALPGGIEPLVASGKLRFTDEVDYRDGSVLHLASPVELGLRLDELLPPPARAAVHVVVTLFDLTPQVLAEHYLVDPGLRRRYRARLELVRGADHVLAISHATAADARQRLGIDQRRISTVPLAPSAAFRHPVDRDAARAAAARVVPGLRPPFVLYTGGTDHRKNVDRLLRAWGLLDDRIRRRWQIVVAGSVAASTRHHYEVLADSLAYRDRLVVTGFLPDPSLVLLNQAADLVVFPSLHEGFGLPVAEALACGTPALGSDRSSIAELLPAEATFDPEREQAIAAAVAAALTDERRRARLAAHASAYRRSWADVAHETLDAYGRVPRRAGRRRRPPPRLALVSPLPPQPGGVARYTARLLAELHRLVDVDVYVDGPPHERAAITQPDAPGGVQCRPLGAFAAHEALAGPYPAVLYTLGNSEYHTGALQALLARPGIVLAHDVRLTSLYRFARWQHPTAVPGGFQSTLHRIGAGRYPDAVGRGEGLDADEADRWGVLMAREVIDRSRRYLVTSPFAAQLARLDAAAGDVAKITVVPFAVPEPPWEPAPAEGRPGPPTIATFGVVNDRKQPALLLDAFARLRTRVRDARLVFVGPAGDADARAIRAMATARDLQNSVELVGGTGDDEYWRWLDRTWVAVQLRSDTNGETSAATGDCLAAGVPTVVSAIGPARDLPASATVHVAADVSADELGQCLAGLVDDPNRRRHLSAGARAFAARNSFRVAAEEVLAACELL